MKMGRDRRVFSDKIAKEKLKPGDHIYPWRRFRLKAHHGGIRFPSAFALRGAKKLLTKVWRVFSNKIGEEEPKPGGHTYSWRCFRRYAHHGGTLIASAFSLRVFCNKIGKEELKPGDHIYSWRRLYIYAHHGIYDGNGKVTHFTPGAGHTIRLGTMLRRYISSSSPPSITPCPTCGDQSQADGVISSCLECFLSDGELRRFQYGVSSVVFLIRARGGTCTRAPSDPPKDILHRAKHLLENGFGDYNIFNNNCEDFAIFCKTGLLVFNGQSAKVMCLLVVMCTVARLLPSGIAYLLAVGFVFYCIYRYISDIGSRQDVMKISVERLVGLSGSGLDEPEAAEQTPKDE